MVRTQIQLEASELERIRQAASSEACSVSHFIRESVLERLSREEQRYMGFRTPEQTDWLELN